MTPSNRMVRQSERRVAVIWNSDGFAAVIVRGASNIGGSWASHLVGDGLHGGCKPKDRADGRPTPVHRGM